MVNADSIIKRSRANESDNTVTTARYTVDVVFNEENPDATAGQHIKDFRDEFQRALDAGFFTDLRYDTLEFDVVSREVLDVAPAGNEVVEKGMGR